MKTVDKAPPPGRDVSGERFYFGCGLGAAHSNPNGGGGGLGGAGHVLPPPVVPGPVATGRTRRIKNYCSGIVVENNLLIYFN